MKCLIFIVSFWLFAAPLAPIAQAAVKQSSTPIILPGQALYFLESLKEKIQLFTAISPAAKAQLYLDFANQRLAEYEALSKQGKNDLAKKSFDQYLEKMELSIQARQALKQQTKSTNAINGATIQPQNQTKDLSDASRAVSEALPDKLSRTQKIARQTRELMQKLIFASPTSTNSNTKESWLSWLTKMFNKLWPNNLQLIKR